MPRRSSRLAALEKQLQKAQGQVGTSGGDHVTNRKKDAVRSQQYHAIRKGYSSRSATWKN